MVAARQAQQHTCSKDATNEQRSSRSAQYRRHCPTEPPTRTIAQDRTDERFVCETAHVRDYLVRRATRLTAQRADAEDLVQDTLLKAYVSFGGYREGTDLKAWLARIMVNTWVDRHRSTQRRPAEQLAADFTDSQLAASASHAISGSGDSAETEALQSLPGEVELAVRNLPDDLRETLYYACVAGYRNTEIADILGIPVGTVGSRLHRGKAWVRDALVDPGDHP